jgi:arylsulfatase A-like enzyme
MESHPRIATEVLPEPTNGAASKGPQPVGAAPATILVVAVWIGLTAGFIDLGLMITKKRLIDGDFYRLGENFGWIIPTGVLILVLVPGMVLALFALVRRQRLPLGGAVGLLSFVGFLDVCARLPLEPWSALALSGGLAVQAARLARPRGGRFLLLVRRTAPVLVGIVLAIALATCGRRAYSEHRALDALPPPPSGARNVLLIVWDTVRAANLSLYGYNRPTTPNLQRLAGQGVRFDLALATSSWTLPSHASLFTGRWPHEVGVDWKSPLRDDMPTLAEYLASHGYDTAGFAANLEYCTRETGLARGFAHYEDFPIDVYDAFSRYVALGRRIEIPAWALALDMLMAKCFGRWYDLVPRSNEHAKNAAQLDRAFLRWLERRRDGRRPFFAFLNFNDAHSPYEVPDRSTPAFGLRPASWLDRQTLLYWNVLDKAKLTAHDVRMAADVYDDSIAYLDQRLGMLLQELRRRGVLDNTIVIVTSDHGEHLGDHLLFFHGCSLYRQLVHVPLVILGNTGAPAARVIAEPVSLCDIPATVVDLLELGRDAPFPGRSLARCWRRPAPAASAPAEPLLMETGKPEFFTNQGREPAAKGPMKSLVAGGLHYIRTADGLEELYILNIDPEEQFDVAGSPNSRTALERFRLAVPSMLKRP